MIKAVFDTNIFVSAIIRPQGLPARLVDMATQGRFELFISTQIIDELVSVLAYPRIKQKYRLEDEIAEVFIGFLLKTCPNIGQAPELYVVPNDPKDNPVVSTALACDADFLVTGDKAHILSLGDIGRLKIVTVKVFADMMDSAV
jgi:putative PIN family toxin of toxin-antitoxin system